MIPISNREGPGCRRADFGPFARARLGHRAGSRAERPYNVQCDIVITRLWAVDRMQHMLKWPGLSSLNPPTSQPGCSLKKDFATCWVLTFPKASMFFFRESRIARTPLCPGAAACEAVTSATQDLLQTLSFHNQCLNVEKGQPYKKDAMQTRSTIGLQAARATPRTRWAGSTTSPCNLASKTISPKRAYAGTPQQLVQPAYPHNNIVLPAPLVGI